MCGIVGHINRANPINLELFNSMRDTLFHRGPDDAATQILNFGSVALGHRRLSIIDLSEDGKQPMCNEDGKVWLTFNGEIYNFQELKNELKRCGHIFKSKTDSEVLIHGYEEWGIENLLVKLKGMFAFAIWDDRVKKLFAGRDRFGIKPFCYYQDDQQFIFASEIKAIIKAPTTKRELDKSALADFFTYSYVPSPKSIWKHIRKLPPATFMIYEPETNKIKIKEYWQLRIDNKFISREEAIEQTNFLIRKATKEHMVSDVPVGLFLSGGYDSTTLLMHMKDLGYNVSSFSIGFENSKRSEHKQARKIAAIFGSNHCEEVLPENLDTFSLLQKLAYYYDEPFAISSMIPYYYVSNLASNHTKVVLAGDGGDEAFAGYNWHYHIQKYYNYPTWRSKLKQVYYGREKILLEQYNRWMTGVYNDVIQNNILEYSLLQKIKKQGLWLFKEYYLRDENPVKAFQYLDVNTFLSEHCLVRADISSMANSLEVRVPFLDHEIFEFTFGLSIDVYFDKKINKHLIKENLNGRVDNDILDMPKRGFSFQHLSKIFDNRFFETLENGHIINNGFLVKTAFQKELSPLLKFHLLMLELWMSKHL